MTVVKPPRFYCGIDWSNRLNDVAVTDRTGEVIARARILATPPGIRELCALLEGLRASHTHGRKQVPIAIETPTGLLVHALRAKGQPIYHIPPSVVAGYRRRISPAPRKSDRSDAELLALVLREGWSRLRPLPDNGPTAAAVTVLAQAQWRADLAREKLQAKLRALLQQANPVAVTAWAHLDHGLRRRQARAVLAAGPTAATAHRLSPYRLSRILAGAGRCRLVDDEAYRLHALFTEPVLRLPQPVEDALAVEVRAMLALFDHACDTAEHLAEQLIETFHTHPDSEIYLSFPGCGPLTGARLLADLGDDKTRFRSARGLRAYAGLAPITWASGSSRQVTHRRVCNRRLKSACHQWAFCSLTRSPGCRALYDRRRRVGDSYAGALRHTAARLLSCLHHCLTTRQRYQEDLAFPDPSR